MSIRDTGKERAEGDKGVGIETFSLLGQGICGRGYLRVHAKWGNLKLYVS